MSNIPSEGSFVTLWSGESASTRSELLEGLESAGIPFSDKSLGDDEVAPTADPLPIDWKPRFGFEVAVSTVDFVSAKGILERVLDREPANTEIPAQPLGAGPLAAMPPITDGIATLQVWSGTDEKQAQFLMSALQENQIPAHYDTSTLRFVILVAPANEARAREIIHEVTDATPPA
jgi:hypothetical protein